jgi:hypothetical protein
MKIMNKIRYIIVWVVVLASVAVYAQENDGNVQIDTSSAAYVRYEPAPGTAKWIRLRNTEGFVTKVGDQFVQVEKNFSNRLKRRSCATFTYEVLPTNKTGYMVIRSHTRKNAIGVSGSYLFYGAFTNPNNLLMDEYKDNFEGATIGLRDFSVGGLYARQLCAKNRHRLSLEIAPAYRQIKQSFTADRYTNSFAATDPDGFAYTRLVTVTNYQEEVLQKCVSVPLNLRYDLFALKYLSIFVGGGLDNVFAVSEDRNVSFDAKYAGQYGEDLFNVVIDENGYYDFGTFTENRFKTEDDIAFRYSLYGTAMAGLQLFIGPVLSIEVAGVYHHRLYSNVPDTQEGVFCLSKTAEEYQSMAFLMKPAAKNRLGVNVKLKFNF